MRGERTIGVIDVDPSLYAPDPATRLAAARAATGRTRRRLVKAGAGWPDHSPGSVNAWLLLVTTKPPTWRDPLIVWPDDPPAIGTAHAGHFYPDPLGFWAEVRRWSLALVRRSWPEAEMADALAVTSLIQGTAIEWARTTMHPRVLLFLDEPAWVESGLTPTDPHAHGIPDPHRPGQVYEGFWGTLPDGTVVGKAPQHPAAHKLYRAADVDAFLRAAPL